MSMGNESPTGMSIERDIRDDGRFPFVHLSWKDMSEAMMIGTWADHHLDT